MPCPAETTMAEVTATPSLKGRPPWLVPEGLSDVSLSWRKLGGLKAYAPEFIPAAKKIQQASLTTGEDGKGAAATQPVASTAMPPAEVFLMEMLAAMDIHMQQLRDTQQGLVATVELACRRALQQSFDRLVLVGSAALRVETPGSDVDVVCFTRPGYREALGLPVDVLRRVHWSLSEFINQFADFPMYFSMELIDDARVPILRVLWGPPGNQVAVDVSVDQSRPLEHVRWFQRVGVAPRPSEPPPTVAPLVTLTLRCVKWWLKQRQIPPKKEGGLPTIAWLLMAVHVCSLKETSQEAMAGGQRPMAALLASMAAFFRHYQSLACLDGVLHFSGDGSSSDFRRRQQTGQSAWSELAVLDPTSDRSGGQESLNVVPRLFPATQLLLSYELQRAHERLSTIPGNTEGRSILEDALCPVAEGLNALPSYLLMKGTLGALVVCDEVVPGTGIQQVELALIDSVSPRPGWTAPFLLRSDERSEVVVRLLDVEERSCRCRCRHGRSPMTLSPANFICQVFLEHEGGTMRIDSEGFARFHAMRQIIVGIFERRQRVYQQRRQDEDLSNETEKDLQPKLALSNVTNLLSPDRSSSNKDIKEINKDINEIKDISDSKGNVEEVKKENKVISQI